MERKQNYDIINIGPTWTYINANDFATQQTKIYTVPIPSSLLSHDHDHES